MGTGHSLQIKLSLFLRLMKHTRKWIRKTKCKSRPLESRINVIFWSYLNLLLNPSIKYPNFANRFKLIIPNLMSTILSNCKSDQLTAVTMSENCLIIKAVCELHSIHWQLIFHSKKRNSSKKYLKKYSHKFKCRKLLVLWRALTT